MVRLEITLDHGDRFGTSEFRAPTLVRMIQQEWRSAPGGRVIT
jgi:hypothetical protein